VKEAQGYLPGNPINQRLNPTLLVLIPLSINFSGMAFGTGSAVAHRAVDAVMGPRTIQHETVVSEAAAAPTPTANSFGSDACNIHTKAFQDVCCLPRLILNCWIMFWYINMLVNTSLVVPMYSFVQSRVPFMIVIPVYMCLERCGGLDIPYIADDFL